MLKRTILTVFAYFMLVSVMNAQPKVVSIADFIKEKDASLAVHEALEYCKQIKAQKLVFPKGRYDFFSDYTYEKYIYIAGNVSDFFGPNKARRFVFDLSNMKNFEVDGGGSEFVLHGYLSPFSIENSSNIRLNNFSIDYVRTFHSEGKIIAIYKDSVDVSFSSAYPYKVNKNILTFWDDNYTIQYPWWITIEFDTEKKEFNGRSYSALPADVYVKELKPGIVRLNNMSGRTVGNTMVFNASHRFVPAFNIYKCTDIDLSNIFIYHCGAMGIVAQLTRNITLDKINVMSAPNSGRMISTTADITYFVSCFGKITIQNCVFENAQDDFTNIHGTYAIINQILSPTEVIVQYGYGIEYVFSNDSVEIVEAPSYLTYAENKVVETQRLNSVFTKVTLSKPLPDKVKVGDKIASIDEYPEVLIQNCKFSNGRSRMLLGSRAKTIIEKNYFHTPTDAIVFDGWADEQFGIRDLTIRDNVFDNCGYLGRPAISVGTPIEENRRAENKFHRNILIENNTFKVVKSPILNLYCVDGLTFRNNKIERTTDYKQLDDNKELFKIEHSSNIKIER